MDNRPIGFFDSGLGGLTSIPVLKSRIPNEKVIYFGDTARTPYGSKAPETIKKFAVQIVDYLISKDVKMIVIACNTVTSLALDMLRERYPQIPILGVIEPTVARVVSDRPGRVGIVATRGTINSGVYARTINAFDSSIETYSMACPAIVPLIEEGIIDDEIMDLTIKHYMDDFIRDNHLDKLILGCTHYPLVESNIKRLYPEVTLYSSSVEVIGEVEKLLATRDMFAEPNELDDRFYASDISENFVRMTNLITQSGNTKIELKNLDYDCI